MDKEKINIIRSVALGKSSVNYAAVRLKKSERTIRRLVQYYRIAGAETLIHGNRGKVPVNKLNHEKIWNLYKSKYDGFTITLFCEKLLLIENIKISEGTVRKIFRQHDAVSPRAWKSTKHSLRKKLQLKLKLSTQQKDQLVQLETENITFTPHPTQPRCKYFGEEIQMDACNHHWFGTVKANLHLAIDDATGKLLAGYFAPQETLNGYYNVLAQILRQYGIPNLIKTDKRTVFEYESKKRNPETDSMPHFALACRTLGIDLQCSSIPEFKPRIERSFGTLQWRLPQEMKLAGVSTLEQANEFLNSYIKKFNEQFAINNGIKSCFAEQPSEDQIQRTLIALFTRVTDSGSCIKIDKKYYAMYDRDGCQLFLRSHVSVSVIRMMDGKNYVLYNDKLYGIVEVPKRQKISKDIDTEDVVVKKPKINIPSFDQYWRISNSMFFKKKYY